MDRLKKKRTNLRRQLTKIINEIDDGLSKDPIPSEEVRASLEMAEKVQLEVEVLNQEILDRMYDDDGAEEADMDAETDRADEYRKAFLIAKKRTEKAFGGPDLDAESVYSAARSGGAGNTRKGYALPKIKLKEFNGDFKEWLGFWSQFKRIHEDPNLDTNVKFHYLDMAIVKESPAKDVIDIYPKTEENYPKAVAALIKRFGRDELQVEVYVRELIKLLIHNVNNKDKINLSKLHDQLESHLRSLESLGVTAKKNEATLFPLVESCLPVPVLRAWERSQLSKVVETPGAEAKGRLHYLMEFLSGEVESDQRISLASEGFGTKETNTEPSNKQKKIAGKFKKADHEREPTAAGLVNEVKRYDCAFCGGSHSTGYCNKAHELSLSEKRDKLRKSGCCFTCLRKGCRSKDCKSEVTCFLCGNRHNAIMCADTGRKVPEGKPRPEQKGKAEEEVNIATSTANINESSGEVYLQTAIVELVNGNKRKKVRALFDTGSQRTHIMKSTAIELGYKQTGSETLTHVLFGGTRTEVVHQRYQVGVKPKDSLQPIVIDVLDQTLICNRLPSVPKGPWMSELRHRGIWLEDMEKGHEDIQMLIGGDVYGKLLTGRTEQLLCGLTAVETKLGWTVMGTLCESGSRAVSQVTSRNNHSMLVTSMSVSEMSVPDLWRLEAIGINDPIDAKSKQEEEAEVLQKFEETVTRNPDGRYVVKLPWRHDVPDLPTNRTIAEKRLLSTTRRLKSCMSMSACSDPVEDTGESLLGTIPESALLPTQGADWNRAGVKMTGFQTYNEVFKEWMAEDIIEEIQDESPTRAHYLPHRAVIKEESTTTKVRPVFDASCKSGRAPSLNDCLEKGPNLIDLIPSVMLRFREGKIGVISDIRKAFLMIEVAEEDRDYLRFLWWETPACDKMKVFRHKRVVFGVNSSPFLLGAVIQHHLKQYQGQAKDVADKTLRSLYVDNCVTSLQDKIELNRFREISTAMLAEAQMDLRMWQDSFNVWEDMEDRYVPVLGMKWDRYLDVLYCDSPIFEANESDITKRIILSYAQRIYDPLGIVSPVTLQPKMLLQEAWAQKKGWDDAVENDAKKRFLQWTEELPMLSQIQVPRCFVGVSGSRDGWSIHCFSDASSDAYAAVVFLRAEGDPVSVQLLQAKARVAPMAKSTIPRLELLGCLIGARLTSTICEALDLKDVQCHFWSDSSTALSWIRRNDDWGTFVGNRVREILSLTEANQWNHVPGKVNPADLPSRGCGARDLLVSKWWEGPEWLKLDPSEWPQETQQIDEEEVLHERKKTAVIAVSTTPRIGSPWYLEGREGYTSMLRRASYVFRFLDHVKKQVKFSGKVTEDEIRAAEKRLVREVQAECFANEEPFQRLGVFKDAEGILRVKTKLLMRQDKLDFKVPMLLPNSHPFVEQLIRETHVRSCHAGAQALISVIRERFWILHTRKAVNAVIHLCQRCRRFVAKNVEVEVSVLPEDRVRDAAPFEIVGVDLAGPLFLRDGRKAWIVLFTCAVFRAVHLELVTSLDTEHFLQALRRFVARRGRPSTIYSDNGTNFRGAVNLMRGLDWEKIQRRFGVERMTWKFSPPTAPWFGGFWERLVRSVKGLLIRVLGKSSVFYEELLTILCDVESVINQRPLTVMTEDDDDLVALTPSMFLQGVRESGVPELDEIDMEGMKRRFRYRQELVEELRSRFRKEYLANLLQRAKEKPNFKIRVGDLVLIGEDFKKRLEWQLGKVEELILGKDGHARVARIRTPAGVCTRPVRRLFPMELNAEDEEKVDLFTKRGRKIIKPQRFQ